MEFEGEKEFRFVCFKGFEREIGDDGVGSWDEVWEGEGEC